MGANQRTAATALSNMGAYEGENIGTNHGTPAQNDSTWTSAYRPQTNMTQLLWNAGFSSASQWSSTDGTGSSGAGPGGSGTGPGVAGSNANWVGSGTVHVDAASAATASAAISIANVISISVTGGGAGYSSAPTVTISGGSGSGATATAVVSGGAVTAINMTSQGTGYSSMDSLTVTVAAPGQQNIYIAAQTLKFSQGTAHSDYIYQPATSTDGIPIDGQATLGSGTGWGGETPYDADSTTANVAKIYIKYQVSSATPDTNDMLTVKLGTYLNDDFYGSYKLHADAGGAFGAHGGYSSNQHGNVAGSAGSLQYWVAEIPDLNKFKGEPCTITADDGSGAGATGYVVTSDTSTGAVASVTIDGGGSSFTASEAVTVTGTASSKTSCKGTAVGTGALTGVTVTTAGTDYKSGRIYITIAASGQVGRDYTIKQCELYVANRWDNSRGRGHAQYATFGSSGDSDGGSGITFTRNPEGNILPGKTISAQTSKYNISGDYVDVSKVTVPVWDFSYVQGDGHQSDKTSSSSTYASSGVFFKYTTAMDTNTEYTIRTRAYINNTTPNATHASDYYGIGLGTLYLEEINQVVRPAASKSVALNDERSQSLGGYAVNSLGQWQNSSQSTNPFFIYEKLHYRIETTEPISEFYIDWDDGEDNSPEKANYQVIKLEEPSFFATAEHVYTTHGSHYPVLRAKSIDGYQSKYYTAYEDQGTLQGTVATSDMDTTTNTLNISDRGGIATNDYLLVENEYLKVTGGTGSGAGALTVTRAQFGTTAEIHTVGVSVYQAAGSNQNDISGLESQTLPIGQNEFSMVSVDDAGTHKLPVFRPANKPPVAVLKADRTRVLSGIQNELFSASAALAAQTVFVDCTGNSKTGSTNSAEVKITYESLDTSGDDQQILTTTKKDTQTISNVSRILKVELVNLKEAKTATNNQLMAGERVYLRKTNASGYAFCYVSLGNPIVTETDSASKVTLDASESRARASNVSISEYYIDDGHHITGSSRHNPAGDDLQDAAHTASTLQTGDVLSPKFLSYYKSLDASYSFQSQLDPQDANKRFLSKEVLCRALVKDSSSTTRTDAEGGDTIEYSFLDHDMANAYAPSTPPRPATMKTNSLILGALKRDNPNWVDLFAHNRSSINSGNEFLLGGGHNSTTARAPTGTAHTANAENYILMVRKDKFDRVYIKTFNDYSTQPPTVGTTLPNYRISLYYPSKNSAGAVIWKPLPFVDTTAYGATADSSLMRDGSLLFKPPADWEKAIESDITWDFGANFNVDSSGSNGPDDLWKAAACAEGYGLLACFATKVDHTAITKSGISFMKPYNNTYSQLITVLDPTHVSLNTKTIAQSIGFSRQGTYSVMTSRLGKAEIRRISANAGRVSFGSVDLVGNTTRKDVKEFQQDGTPVYLDVEHKNGDFTRFFGVIETMSEDHPTGAMLPKFGLNMIVSHIVEFDSSGAILSNDYISLGGNVDYEPKYIH